MFEKFTDTAKGIVSLANLAAQQLNHEYIGTEHILLGLIARESDKDTVAIRVLESFEISLDQIRLNILKLIKAGPETVTVGRIPSTPRAKKVYEYAIEESRSLKHDYVSTEHLLLGLLREQDGAAAQVLMNLNLRLEDVRERIVDILSLAEVETEPKKEEVAPPPPSSTKDDRVMLEVLQSRDPNLLGKTFNDWMVSTGHMRPNKEVKVLGQPQVIFTGKEFALFVFYV